MGRCLTRDTLYLFIISACVDVGRSVSRHVSKRSSRAREAGGTEPIIPLLYILGKERQIYIYRARAISVKLAICFYLKIKELLANLLNATFCFF